MEQMLKAPIGDKVNFEISLTKVFKSVQDNLNESLNASIEKLVD